MPKEDSPRSKALERETGFEPAALCLGSRCATIAPLPHHLRPANCSSFCGACQAGFTAWQGHINTGRLAGFAQHKRFSCERQYRRGQREMVE